VPDRRRWRKRKWKRKRRWKKEITEGGRVALVLSVALGIVITRARQETADTISSNETAHIRDVDRIIEMESLSK